MADFTSGFWNWFIIVPTVLGILGCFVMVRWLSGATTPKGAEVKTMGHVWDESLEEYNHPLPKWWLNMFYITLFFGIGYLALYPGLGTFKGLLGWTSTGQYESEVKVANDTYGPIYAKYGQTPIPELVNDPEALKVGERLYATYCTTCHGSDARGVRGFPNLRDGDWLWGGTPERIVETITQGRQAGMPPWQAVLGDDGIQAVAHYVRSLSGLEVDTALAQQGAALYATNCVACHGPEAKGNPMLGAANLSDEVWLYGGSHERVVETLTGGRAGRMPAWGNFLGNDRVHILAAYVYSLSQQPQ